MTITKYIEEYLERAGMFPEQVKTVIRMALRPEADGGIHRMVERIDDDLEDYPPVMKNVFVTAVNRLALEYCEEHYLDGWLMSVFMAEEERKANLSTGVE